MELSEMIHQAGLQLQNSIYTQWGAASFSSVWWILLVVIVAVLYALWWKHSHKPTMEQQHPENKESTNLAQPAMKPIEVENRNLNSSKNAIPLENIVISEIPISKAISIGHLEPIKEENDNKNQ